MMNFHEVPDIKGYLTRIINADKPGRDLILANCKDKELVEGAEKAEVACNKIFAMSTEEILKTDAPKILEATLLPPEGKEGLRNNYPDEWKEIRSVHADIIKECIVSKDLHTTSGVLDGEDIFAACFGDDELFKIVTNILEDVNGVPNTKQAILEVFNKKADEYTGGLRLRLKAFPLQFMHMIAEQQVDTSKTWKQTLKSSKSEWSERMGLLNDNDTVNHALIDMLCRQVKTLSEQVEQLQDLVAKSQEFNLEELDNE